MCVTLVGCTAGPEFVPPAAPTATSYLPMRRQPAAFAGSGLATQKIVPDRHLSSVWWELLGSRDLDELIRRGMEHNADIKAQEAAIRAAQASARAQRGAFFPTATANYNVIRQKVATESLSSGAASGANIYSVHTAQVTAGFVPDVFGGTRRLVEIADSQVEIETFRRQAAILTMTSSIALATIQEASLRGQISALRRLIATQSQVLSLLRKQEEVGQIGQHDLVAQETAVAQTMLLLPPLERQLGQQRNLLAVLTGVTPDEGVAPTFELRAFKLPRELPVLLPADLVRQRPDVRVAEAAVQVANAQVGVAIANRLPQIKLSGNVGSAASALSKLFTGGTLFWTVAGDVAQPLFDGFALHYRQKAAEEALQQSIELYRGVVLVAFQNVADALLALEADAKSLSAAMAAERAATRSLALVRHRLEQGQISLPNLLNAQEAVLQTSVARVQAEASRLANTIVLFQALGGGWWAEPIEAKQADREQH